ncbi:BID domain-containing T4SS effector [Bartonella gliris]|uniref:BID domain-containing T4SS effector n=1 Tax=Bartonella gliris TaxID=3004109 RepID=UPI00295E7D8B|nr:BID domain-containing T4SS effector [Bartonella gliris]
MKKKHPSHASQANLEELYAKVNKPNRGAHPQRPEEVDYARIAPQQRAQTSLSNNELAEKTGKDQRVHLCREEVAHWCINIFGNSCVLQEQMQEILKNPSVGEPLSRDVAANPRSFHKLVGYNICGLKTAARKRAEGGVRYLCNALDGYTAAVKRTRERLLQTPRAEEKRQTLQQERAQKLHKEKDVQHDRSQDIQAPKMPRKKMAFAI